MGPSVLPVENRLEDVLGELELERARDFSAGLDQQLRAGTLPPPPRYEHIPDDGEYDPARDCALGQVLPFERKKRRKKHAPTL